MAACWWSLSCPVWAPGYSPGSEKPERLGPVQPNPMTTETRLAITPGSPAWLRSNRSQHHPQIMRYRADRTTRTRGSPRRRANRPGCCSPPMPTPGNAPAGLRAAPCASSPRPSALTRHCRRSSGQSRPPLPRARHIPGWRRPIASGAARFGAVLDHYDGLTSSTHVVCLDSDLRKRCRSPIHYAPPLSATELSFGSVSKGWRRCKVVVWSSISPTISTLL